MRETIASTWVYQLVIIFILIFVAFLILSLTYSKNYKTKNELINIIEKYEGVNNKSVQIMNNYLKQVSYGTKGKCPTGEKWIGATSLDAIKFEKVKSSGSYYYCLNKKWNTSSSKLNSTISDNKGNKVVVGKTSKMFYQIKTFFKFNLPVVGDIFTFTIDGTTNDIFTGKDIFDTMK